MPNTQIAPRPIHLADILEQMADAVPDRLALITSTEQRTYKELDERANRLANHLAANGVRRGDHVAIHAMNCAEWVESFYACCKLGASAVNVNFRYVEAELRYLYDNADAVAVVVAPEFVPALDAIADVLPGLRHRLVIGAEYEAALAASSPQRPASERSGDDVYLLYTGGTTGMPKGVMWRQEDIVLGAMNAARRGAPIESVEQLGVEAAAAPAQARLMMLGPLMHGGAQWAMGNAHVSGGVAVVYSEAKFDPHAVMSMAARVGVHSLSTIGDAMARPLAERLMAVAPGTYDLSNLFNIGNGGAPLTPAVRSQLRAALPNVLILDSYGASETGAAGSKIDEGSTDSSPRFHAGPDVTVLSADGRVCEVGEVGKLARTGHIPLGYYKDPVKTAETFPVVDGVRWVVPGDFACREDDGSISLLGRGSVSINSGGEKIYPEEVEAALKGHPSIEDAAVVGTPNQRWGEQVTALVQLRAGEPLDVAGIIEHCRRHVADYKVPKAVFAVDLVPRTQVGKVDYRGTKELAVELLTDE